MFNISTEMLKKKKEKMRVLFFVDAQNYVFLASIKFWGLPNFCITYEMCNI